jgi:hypothetical protein
VTDKDRVAILHRAIEEYFKPNTSHFYDAGKRKVEGLRKAYLKTGGSGPTLRSSWFELETVSPPAETIPATPSEQK